MNACGRIVCNCCHTSDSKVFRDGYVPVDIASKILSEPRIPDLVDRTLSLPQRGCGMCNGQGSFAYDRYEPRRLDPCKMCRGTGTSSLY